MGGFMNSALRAQAQAAVLDSLFTAAPPDPSAILGRVAQEAATRGYSLAESGLQPWARKLELELGALSGGVTRSLGRVPGLGAASRDLAGLAVSGVMHSRGRGLGPESWALWLYQGAAQATADAVVNGALASLPVPSIVTQAMGALQTVSNILEAGREAASGEILPTIGLQGDAFSGSDLRVRGTGSFGPVSFVASPERVMTWREASRGHKARYAVHELLGAKPRSEYLSPDVTPTKFSVRLDSGLGASPERDAEELAAMCREGRVERLVLGGRNLGLHYIEEINEVWRRMGPGGVVMVSDLELTLKEYE